MNGKLGKNEAKSQGLRVLWVTAAPALNVALSDGGPDRFLPALKLTYCADLAQARTAIKSVGFDAIIWDWDHPQGHGGSQMAAIQELAPQAPLIALFPNEDPGWWPEAFGQGLHDCLSRPGLDVCKLGQAIQQARHRHQSLVDLQENYTRCQRQLNSITDYIFTVTIENGQPVDTTHGSGCLRITGYSPEEYKADPYLWHRMIHPDDRQPVTDSVAKVLGGELVPPVEHRIQHKDGSIRWVKNTTVPHKNFQGQVYAYDGLISDITERKQAEVRLKDAYAELAKREESLRRMLAELRKTHEDLKASQLKLIQAEKMETVGLLTAGIAHEVKNPLQILLTGLQILSDPASPGPEIVRIVLADMREAVQRADFTIRALLDFSAAHELNPAWQRLSRIVEASMRLVKYELAKNRVTIAQEIDPSLPQLYVDRVKLEQVFVNILMNSIQAMPNGGILTIRAWPGPKPDLGSVLPAKAEDGVMIQVEDTGCGIPKDKLARVFEPFFSTKPTGRSTGLGLTVVKQIITWHGGTIDIRNRSEGGVSVTLWLGVKARPVQKIKEAKEAKDEFII